MIRTRLIRYFSTKSTSKAVELLRNYQVAHEESVTLSEHLKTIQEQVAQREKNLNVRNKEIQEMRDQLIRDIKKSDQVREDARKKIQAHKAEAVHNFAEGLINLGNSLQDVKQHEKEDHHIDLIEGYNLTSRGFFSTLEKFNIRKMQIKLGSKYTKNTMLISEQKQAKGKDLVGTVAEVLESGWEAEGKVIHKAKVVIYK